MDVARNDDRHRFEVTEDGHLGVLTYREAAGLVILIHTEVPPELRGRGSRRRSPARLSTTPASTGSWCAPSVPSFKHSSSGTRSTRTSRLRRRRREDRDGDTNAEAVWEGTLREGAGRVKLGSGAFEGPYSFRSRFEEGDGHQSGGADRRRPRGLLLHGPVGRPHRAKLTPRRIRTTARVHLENVEGLPPRRGSSSTPRRRSRDSTPRRSRSTPRRPRRTAPSRSRWPPSPSRSTRGSCSHDGGTADPAGNMTVPAPPVRVLIASFLEPHLVDRIRSVDPRSP